MLDKQRISILEDKVKELEEDLVVWKEIDEFNMVKHERIRLMADKIGRLFYDFEEMANLIDETEEP
jgi:hypothetical protein